MNLFRFLVNISTSAEYNCFELGLLLEEKKVENQKVSPVKMFSMGPF